MSEHDRIREYLAGAALDDLDPGERAELDAHLPGCDACRTLAAGLDDALAELALAAPAREPRASLQDDVLAAIRESDRTVAPVSPATSGPERIGARPSRGVVWASLGLAAVLAVVAIGLGVRTVQLQEDLTEARAALLAAEAEIATQGAVMTVLTDPGHVTVGLEAEPLAADARAVVVFRPGSTDSYLMADGLPPTPAGSVYQLWVADAAGVHPLETFHHDGSGPVIAPFGVDLGGADAAMVTLEPEGGAQGEPGPQVVFGEI
jgi:hypothetical protein